MSLGEDHRHCKVCGKVCAPGAETCSRECAGIRDDRLRSRRFWTGVMYVMIVFLAAVLLISFLR